MTFATSACLNAPRRSLQEYRCLLADQRLDAWMAYVRGELTADQRDRRLAPIERRLEMIEEAQR